MGTHPCVIVVEWIGGGVSNNGLIVSFSSL